MTASAEVVRDVLRREGRDRLRLRALVVAGSVAATSVAVIAGGTARPTGQLLLLLLAIAAAVVPDGPLPGILGATQILFWAVTVPRPVDPADLALPALAAVAIGVVHLACSALSVWPAGAVVPPAGRRRWRRQGAVLALLVLAGAGLGAATLSAGQPGHSLVTTAALVAAAGAGVAAYRVVSR